MLNRHFLSLIALLLMTANAYGHDGTRIWIDQSNGQLVTLTSDNDFAPTAYSPSRLFATKFGYDSINPLTTEFPGFEAPRGTQHHLNNGTVIGFNIAGPAWFFESNSGHFQTTADAFGHTGAPQIGIGISFGNTRATADGPVAGVSTLLTFTSTAGVSNQNHAHVEFAIMGNGVSPSAAPAGVYALPLELTSSSLQTSETFYLLLGTAGTLTAPGSALFNQAMLAAQTQFIAMPGDTDGDGDIDDSDLGTSLANYTGPVGVAGGRTSADGDTDSDGDVDDSDLGSSFAGYTGPLSPAVVPEPATLGLAALLSILAMRVRRPRDDRPAIAKN